MASKSDRAKQFMPFASLRGYYNLVRESELIKVPKKELSETEAEKISYKLNQVKKGSMVKIIFYNNETYNTIEGIVSKIDKNLKYLNIVKTKINFDDITDISGEKIFEL